MKILSSILMTATIFSTVTYIDYEVPKNIDTSFKTYMDYRTITNESSMQYELQQMATTDELGFRKIGDDYMVAMGTYYSKTCGKRFEVVLDSGTQFNLIVSDIKNPSQTDINNMYHPSIRHNEVKANVLEFIIDSDVMDSEILNAGDVSKLSLEGQIISIREIKLEPYTEKNLLTR